MELFITLGIVLLTCFAIGYLGGTYYQAKVAKAQRIAYDAGFEAGLSLSKSYKLVGWTEGFKTAMEAKVK